MGKDADGPVVAGLKRDLRTARRWSSAFAKARRTHAFEAESFWQSCVRFGLSVPIKQEIDADAVADLVCLATERAPLSHDEWRALIAFHKNTMDLSFRLEHALDLLSDESRAKMEREMADSDVVQVQSDMQSMSLALGQVERWINRFPVHERERVLYMMAGINHNDTKLELGMDINGGATCREVSDFRARLPRGEKEDARRQQTAQGVAA